MTYLTLSVFLYCLSLLPAAFLRYYPFRVIASPAVRRSLLYGHLVIFLAEFSVLFFCFGRGILPLQGSVFSFLFNFGYLPYEVFLIYKIHPYWFRHLFVLGLQAMYMLLCHTLTLVAIALSGHGNDLFNDSVFYFCVYIPLFLAGMPLMMALFRWLFTETQFRERPSFWKYIGPVPLLICYYQSALGFYNLSQEFHFIKSMIFYIIFTRVIMFLIGVFLVLSIRSGARQKQKMLQVRQKNLEMERQLEELSTYAAELRKQQQELAIIRHDSRHQLRVLGELMQADQYDEAAGQLERLLEEMEKEGEKEVQ